MGRFSRMFVADNDHLHHRLVYLGMSHLQTTFLLLLIASGLTAAGVAMTKLNIWGRLALITYLALSLFFILNRLGFVGRKVWLFVPRVKPMPERIVGVIEPDDVFMHSLKSYQQDSFDFLPVPQKLTAYMGADLSAIIVHNSDPTQFDEQWTALLRAEEFQEVPAIVLAGQAEIERVQQMNKGGYRLIRFLAKPVQVQELLRQLDGFAPRQHRHFKTTVREAKFSLAEIAIRQQPSQSHNPNI